MNDIPIMGDHGQLRQLHRWVVGKAILVLIQHQHYHQQTVRKYKKDCGKLTYASY
jgi:hypothetical protein